LQHDLAAGKFKCFLGDENVLVRKMTLCVHNVLLLLEFDNVYRLMTSSTNMNFNVCDHVASKSAASTTLATCIVYA
jgi:hypothetical protein